MVIGRQFRITVVLAVMALTLPFVATAAPPSAEDGRQRALDFRESYGLSTDEVLIDRLQADTTANRDYGVPLTKAELAEMARRQAITDGLGPLVARVGEQRDEYGASMSTSAMELASSCRS